MILKKLIARYKRLKYNRAISDKSIENRFNNIYRKGLWDGKGQSKSGAGSTLESTENIRKMLPEFLSQFEAKSLVDLGCGDFYWMKEVPLPCEYIGLDIVLDVIEQNKKQYGSNKRTFLHHNAIEDDLPESTDVVLCREVLFHLSFEDGLEVLKKVAVSNARYFLATTSDISENEKNIRTGQFRNINLLIPPYNLPPCVDKWVDSSSISNDRYIGIWKVADMRKSIIA